ncbi:MAG: hypothetical protein LBH84_02980 [Prevotellaceae bacterium]|jgi:hypothetical protein|nr:hypothetical protein [Prevotellaceae bacterium]
MKSKMFERMSRFTRILLTAIAGCMCLFGCDLIDGIFDKDEENGSSNEKIEKAYQKIKLTADSILLSDDPIGGFEIMAAEYRKVKEVESVEVTSDGLFIEFKDEQVVGWFIPPDSDPSLFSDELRQMVAPTLQSASLRQSGSKKSILILNQQINEIPEKQELLNQLNKDVSTLFADCDVTIRIGSQVSLEFLGNSLSGYDAIYYIAHGGMFGNHTWICTGQTFNSNKYTPAPLKNTLMINTFVWKKMLDGSITKMSSKVYAINSKFITTQYTSDKSFEGACIYVGACKTLGCDDYGEDTSIAEAFISRGASVYLGWYNSTYSGTEAGYRLYSRLLKGHTINEAMQYLADYPWSLRTYYPNMILIAKRPANVVSDYNDLSVDFETQTIKEVNGKPYPKAYLKYLPSSAGNFRLVEIPFQVNTTGISDLSRTIVTLNGEIASNGGGAVTETGFYLSTKPDVTNGRRTEMAYNGGTNYPEPFKLSYVGLTPKTTYYYRAFAKNVNGVTAYGDVKQFTTLDEQGITEEINKIVPKEIQDEMRDLGLPIYGGGNPPSLSGTYKVAPAILKKSNFQDGYSPGELFNDAYLTFSEQNNTNLTIKVTQIEGDALGWGNGAFIVGEGNNFTVFVELINEKEGKYYCTSAEIFSGTMTPSGIRNLHFALVMIDDNGNPELINNGNGRLFYDSDGISERVNSGVRSTSEDTRHLPSTVNRRKE